MSGIRSRISTSIAMVVGVPFIVATMLWFVAAVLVWVWQAFVWLVSGKWMPLNVGDLTSWRPVIRWKGVQQIADWLLTMDLGFSFALVGVASIAIVFLVAPVFDGKPSTRATK